MIEERRASKRNVFHSPVRYQLKGSQKFNDTIGSDISNSGIGFISEEFIPCASQVILEFDAHRHNRVKVLGEIRRAVNQPFSEKFYIGAKFIGQPMPLEV